MLTFEYVPQSGVVCIFLGLMLVKSGFKEAHIVTTMPPWQAEIQEILPGRPPRKDGPLLLWLLKSFYQES
jgi:hypothetical protein